MKKGQLIIISGPSGVGKGTVIKGLITKYPDYVLSISMTTRPPRDHEVEGIDYFFVSDEQFDHYIEKDAFIEWCQVHTHRYGTLKVQVDAQCDKGNNVFLEIDTQGAKKVRQKYPDTFSIFIAPPSLEDLAKRLQKRNTEGQSELQHRLANANKELAEIGDYNIVLINEDIDRAIDELHNVIDIELQK